MKNTNNSNASRWIIICAMAYIAVAYTITENKYAAICGVTGSMHLNALQSQKTTAELLGEPMTKEDLKELSDLATERMYGCD